MPLLDCGHDAGSPVLRVCRHLLENRDQHYQQRFTGQGVAFDLVCSRCRQDRETVAANLRTVCPNCFEAVQEAGTWQDFTGQPEVKERETGYHFRHETVALAVPLRDRILDIQPVSSLDRDVWVALTQAGHLLRLDLDDQLATSLGRVAESSLDLADKASLHVSPDGQTVAVVNTQGRYGLVMDLVSGKETMRLDRGEYHEDVCTYPVAFFEREGRSLLIHGTDWNRLDISDPRTGTRLTGRSPTTYEAREERPEHYLDYFHCGLTVFPDNEHVVDNGWVWHPVGVVTTWSLRRWLETNVWESEDGPTRQDLCARDYWDAPLCWLPEGRLAVWGFGEDEQTVIPAVRIFDVVSGKEERWFAGPKGNLVYDRYLFSFDKDEGTSVWDVATGERLLRDASFCPLRYHQGTKTFLTPLPDGGFQISRLRNRVVDPSWRSWNGGTVVKLAEAIHAECAFDRLPILADALEEASCQDAEILSHCRQEGPHGKRCWVIEAILANE